jgi:taurine dioxygenase
MLPPAGPRILHRLPPGETSQPYNLFDVRPVSPIAGAEIEGVDLTQPLPPDMRDELRRAFFEWKVLVFRDQDITPQQFADLASVYGDAFDDSVLGVPPDKYLAPFVTRGLYVASQNYWHADTTYTDNPGVATLLRSVVVPPNGGGDTIFADMAAAYDNLPDDIKGVIDGLVAIHDVMRYARDWHKRPDIAEAKFPPVEHPVVRIHPVTGRKTLYVNAQWTREILGWDSENSDNLLSFLCLQALVPEYQFRLKWQPNTVVAWDNQALQHYAVGDYTQERINFRTATRRSQ